MRECDLSSLTPLAGGWSGRDLPRRGGGERTVVRIYAARRGATTRRPRSTPRCCAWCAGCCRCPRCWRYAAATPPPDRPGLLVTSFLPGERGDLLLPAPRRRRGRGRLGARLGGLLADLGGHADAAAGPVRRRRPDVGDFGRADGCPGSSPTAPTALGLGPPTCSTAARRSRTDAQALLDAVGRDLPGAQRPEPQEPAGRPGHPRGHRAAGLGVRARRAPVHRPRQPAALRPRPGVRRRGAGRLPRAARRTPATRPSTWPGRPTCGPWWTWPPGAGENPVAERAHDLLRARSRERATCTPYPAGASRGWTRRVRPCVSCAMRRSLPASQTERTLARYLRRGPASAAIAEHPDGSETGLLACPHNSIHPRNSTPL